MLRMVAFLLVTNRGCNLRLMSDAIKKAKYITTKLVLKSGYVYGNHFKNFIDEKLEMPKKGNNKSLWKFHHFIPYITDRDFKIKDLEFSSCIHTMFKDHLTFLC